MHAVTNRQNPHVWNFEKKAPDSSNKKSWWDIATACSCVGIAAIAGLGIFFAAWTIPYYLCYKALMYLGAPKALSIMSGIGVTAAFNIDFPKLEQLIMDKLKS